MMSRRDGDDPPSILTKAFDLLRAFETNRAPTLTELSQLSGLPKSTVHRLLGRLIELGAVEHHRSGYRIGLDLLRLGTSTPAAAMRDAAMPYLAALQHWSGHAVYLAVPRGFEVVLLECMEPPGFPWRLQIGCRLPSHCSALGKAVLAHEGPEDLRLFLPKQLPQMTPSSLASVDELIAQLTQIRPDGLAAERDETVVGFSAVAAPIVFHRIAVGAIGVGHSTSRVLDPKIPEAVRFVAKQIASHVWDLLVVNGETHLLPLDP